MPKKKRHEYFREDTPLTLRQKKFVKNLVKSGKKGESCVKSGYERSYSSKLLASPKIQSLLVQEMEKQGVGNEKIISKIKEGLEAYQVRKEGGEKLPDYHAQIKYIDMALKIVGGYSPTKHELHSEHREIRLVISPEMLSGLLDTGKITEDEAKELVESVNPESGEVDFVDAEIIESKEKNEEDEADDIVDASIKEDKETSKNKKEKTQ